MIPSVTKLRRLDNGIRFDRVHFPLSLLLFVLIQSPTLFTYVVIE